MGRLSRLAPPISLLPGCHSGGGKVPDGNHGGLKTTGPFNWLESLDKEATKLSPAASWLGPYGLFMLARYPHLRPQPIPDNPHSRIMCESGEMTAARLFAEWKSRIRENTETAVCLEGLSGELRQQLSALMVDIASTFEMRTAVNHSSTFYKHIIKEARVRERMLNRKLKKVRLAIKELKEYAEDSGKRSGVGANDAQHRARRYLGTTYYFAADETLKALDARGHNSAKHHIETAKEFLAPWDQEEVYGMVRLYWFFRHGCALPGNEAEVRVARLRNAFWSSYGAKNITYRAKYDGIDSQGCEGVHITVSRYKPRRGTS